MLIFLIYVDDIILTGASSNLVSQFLHLLSAQFDVKDLGSLNISLEWRLIITSLSEFWQIVGSL